jgi:hypothetical protein
VRRGALVWLVLLAAYATTLGVDATPQDRYSPREAHRLLTAASLAEDRSLELTDEYAARDWERFSDRPLVPSAPPVDGRLVEPQGIGFALLTAPAYAVGGPIAVEVLCAALLALAFALAAALGRRLVPDPWATRAALLVGVSPPALAGATLVSPAPAAAALLTGGLLLALRVREDPRLANAARAAGVVALLPWLGVRFLAPGLVVLVALARWLRRRQRGVTGLVAVEVLLSSAVVLITVNERLFGGLVPSAAEPGSPPGGAAGVDDAGELLGRVPALLGTLVDRDAGLLRWAPVLALAGVSLWLLVRSRRDRVALALPERVDVEVAALLLAATVAAGLAAAALAAPSLHGPWLLPGDVLAVLPAAAALMAWGLRHAPRAGLALGALTLAGSVWLVLGLHLGGDAGLAPPTGPLPWGGLERLLPRF